MENPSKEDESQKKLLISFSWFIRSLKDQIISILSVREGADIPKTVETIKKDTEFRGYNIWILGLSILIASIGLNVNSTAVIIGAMLISPLMGPILGLGLAIGTNDIKLLVTSLRNFVLMVTVSVITSFIFFKISPITELSDEIASRTHPHLFDALIAIFGGLAGIIGNSRSERGNIIPGVAIATALMPPLCVIGYSLAISNYEYLWGAAYLFLLNSSFIAITSIFVVKVMRFPRMHFIEKRNENKVKIAIFIFGLLIFIPSIILFRNVSNELKFKRATESFLSNEFNYKDSYILQKNTTYQKDTLSILEVFILGDPLDSLEINSLNKSKNNYGLEKTSLIIRQGEDKDIFFEHQIEQVSELNENYKDQLQSARSNLTLQDQKINQLKSEIDSLKSDSISSHLLYKELSIHYPTLDDIKGGWIKNYRDTSYHKIPIFIFKWNKKEWSKIKQAKKEKKISEWLKVRLNNDSIVVVH